MAKITKTKKQVQMDMETLDDQKTLVIKIYSNEVLSYWDVQDACKLALSTILENQLDG